MKRKIIKIKFKVSVFVDICTTTEIKGSINVEHDQQKDIDLDNVVGFKKMLELFEFADSDISKAVNLVKTVKSFEVAKTIVTK